MRLQIDPAVCDGLRMCALRAPDLISMDPWGYPIVDSRELAESDAAAARRAMKGCPRRALYAVD